MASLAQPLGDKLPFGSSIRDGLVQLYLWWSLTVHSNVQDNTIDPSNSPLLWLCACLWLRGFCLCVNLVVCAFMGSVHVSLFVLSVFMRSELSLAVASYTHESFMA